MSEIRKPDFAFLLKKQGKKSLKVELFNSEQWGEKPNLRNKGKKYRLRVCGKWWSHKGKKYWTKWEIRDIFWRSIISKFQI